MSKLTTYLFLFILFICFQIKANEYEKWLNLHNEFNYYSNLDQHDFIKKNIQDEYLNIAENIFDYENVELAYTYSNTADFFLKFNDLNTSHFYYTLALKIFENTTEKKIQNLENEIIVAKFNEDEKFRTEFEEYFSIFNSISVFFAEKNNFELAHSYNDQYKELLNLLNNKKFSYDTEYYDKKMVFYNYNKARFFQFERKLEEAEKYFFESLSYGKKLNNYPQPITIDTYANLFKINSLINFIDIREALLDYDEILSVFEILKKNNPNQNFYEQQVSLISIFAEYFYEYMDYRMFDSYDESFIDDDDDLWSYIWAAITIAMDNVIDLSINNKGEKNLDLVPFYLIMGKYNYMFLEYDVAQEYINKAIDILDSNFDEYNNIYYVDAYLFLSNIEQDRDEPNCTMAEFYSSLALDTANKFLNNYSEEFFELYQNYYNLFVKCGDLNDRLDVLNTIDDFIINRRNNQEYSYNNLLEYKDSNEYMFSVNFIRSTLGIINILQHPKIQKEAKRIGELENINENINILKDRIIIHSQLIKNTKLSKVINLSSQRYLENSNLELSKNLKKYQDNILKIDQINYTIKNKFLDINENNNNLIDLLKEELEILYYEKHNLENNISTNKDFLGLVTNEFIYSEEIFKKIDKNELLISYHYNGDELLIIVIDKKEINIYTNKIPENDLNDLLSLYINNFNPYNTNEFDFDLSYKIYKNLFPFDLQNYSNVNHLTIVASDSIIGIPFSTLVTRNFNKKIDNADWLINNYSISYLPTISSIKNKQNEKNIKQTNFVGFGDPILANYKSKSLRGEFDQLMQIKKFESLPETRDEIIKISSLLNNSDYENLYFAEMANEEVVKSLDYSEVDILMFATHGVLSNELVNNYEPGLILTPPEVPSSLNNGVLTASEIMELNLNTEWVLLSACNTAAGESNDSEGLSGLAKSFFYAGAKSLLVSQWYVESYSTVELTTGIFKYMKENPSIDKSKALQLSKLNLIKNTEYKHPFFWAPFILVGDR